MVNREIANLFNQIADLMEIKGEDPFRINSYRKAARSIEEWPEDLTMVAQRGELQKIPGVGKGAAERIQQYLSEGKIAVHEELLSELPASLLDLLAVPGLGPKKVGALYHTLNIRSIDELVRALDAGTVETLPGFGKKSVEKIREGLDFLERSAGRTPLAVAVDVAEALCQQVRRFPGVKKVEMAGSARRGVETVGDLDLLCQADDGQKVVQRFTQLSDEGQVLAAGKTKGSIVVANPYGGRIQVDLRVVPAESFGAALQYFTGSKAHNVRLRELAIKKGYKLNEYGLFKGDRQVAGRTEAEIYKKLGLPWMPPEVREDRGEIEAHHDFSDLIELDDIQGDLHVHTTASDGRNSIEEMIAAAKQRGYRYLAVTEHSHSSAIANGLSADDLERHVEAIRAADKKAKGFKVLAGTECDILADGRLDYPDDVLAELDLVIASIHSAQGQSRDRLTKRTIDAMENPHVHIIGHPSGRLLGKREAMDLDWDKIFEAAARTHTALELSASWQRLDLKDIHVRQAIEAGCMIVINTDAHAVDQLDQMRWGVITARRGWATAENVLNTRPAAQLAKWLAAKQSP